MNIVKPYARLLKIHGQDPSPKAGISALRFIEWCGRISHRSEEAQTDESWERFIKAVVFDHGDWSIVEHASATVDMLVDRGITHEVVRHRLFSFTQESTRFVNYEKKMPPSFIRPPWIVPSDAMGFTDDPRVTDAWESLIQHSEQAYCEMLKCGCPPQIARSVFPNALASRIIITGNLRNWRHFFIMRTTKEAHPQMREVTIPLLAEFKSMIPILFDDIEPMAKQSESMKRMR
jgi:thymidylate synthase (FAD)